MNNSKYRFTLDMHSTISQVSLPLRDNDAGVELRINLTDGGTPYYIADGCRAVFCARKSDDYYLLNDCIIEKNTTICYKLTQQTTTAPGVVDCEIRVYGIDNNLLTSPKFILVVSSRVWHDSDFPRSAPEKHAIDAIFANETARQDAEASRVIAEEEREKTYQEMLDTVRKASDAADILTEKIATGDYNGLTPYIGANGNWWFGDEDTGVQADAGNHTHSTDAITKGLLPLSRGGTGAGDKANALKNLGGITEAEATAIANNLFSGALKMAAVTAVSVANNEAILNSSGTSLRGNYCTESLEIALDFIAFYLYSPTGTMSWGNGQYLINNSGSPGIVYNTMTTQTQYDLTKEVGEKIEITKNGVKFIRKKFTDASGTKYTDTEYSFIAFGYRS
jgi:hypothetical protein